MKYFPYSYGLLVLLFLLNSGTAFSTGSNLVDEQQIKVFLPPSSVINSDEYRLGEIAQLEGEDVLLLEKISQTVIGRSPLPGRKLTVTRSLILSRLRSQKINIKRFVFPGSESSSIQRAALKITGKDIDQVVLKHIREANNNKDLKPRILAKTRDIFLPRGQVSYAITSKGKYKKDGGYRNYEVEFSIDGEAVRIVTVRTYLKLYKEVFIARDTIRRNQIIEESDLLKVRKNVDRLPREYVTDKDQLIGKISKRTINPSEAIRRNTVSAPPLVKSGDRLQIVFETPFLRLSAPGISMAKGRKGERIPVKNLDSKIVVFATVQTRNVVLVN
ncbi:MAG: flagellar basal body P-ring formation protein FlgA [Proteobacteria bacterium]|jgi:flagella basal body P-ring formation protein FlgA|nr:MAG: flagellar basal body P-ring formation protein FlgA [Pseudomonadota bacterium]